MSIPQRKKHSSHRSHIETEQLSHDSLNERILCTQNHAKQWRRLRNFASNGKRGRTLLEINTDV